MVAPSFQSFEIISEVFDKNGRKYIRVKNPKTSSERDVRWYSESEYAKAYGDKETKTPGEGTDAAWEFYWSKEGYPNLKHARGFDNGPILVIRGIRSRSDEEYLKSSVARYAVGIGWYIASTDSLPLSFPKHFKYLLLTWDEFKDGDDNHYKRPSILTNIISKKMQNNEYVRPGKPVVTSTHA